MTPAIDLANNNNIDHQVHSYEHDASAASYGEEAAIELGIDPSQVFKTLVVETNAGELLVAVVPVSHQLNLKSLAKAAKAKRCDMADKSKVQRTTGYILGGVSPLGQKKLLRTFIDVSAQSYATIFVSAGRRGLEIELSPADLASLTNAHFTRLT
ncbi:Cys-tRNA(Pro)/Cys-tRNA(Cys) deacylase [Arenicella chitinivorans]|uniref:Cys-tRNA(Pro)/Cys-tRNA(Cys) deacylase n=1 Tax=Arenicella chitinivorans TaxID=1329800 RepID=A0A918S542_9GAMM|nr:Cys-tRNA(Pro) deacylase [Arenicella chitinivorans]GHA21778.1 Cys-tRNA(Pro)/Cys-tRNA(Cys) deacylase [Arenicella chitinivorans]